MRIGFDAKRAIENFTGLGNYSRSLIELMLKQANENEYYLFTPMFAEHSRLTFLKKFKNVTIVTPDTAISKTLSSSWRSFRIAASIRKNKINVYHGLSHELPFNIQKSNAKSVVTIHDLIFLRYPQQYNFFDRKIYKSKFQYSCQVADKVIAISEQTKKDIIEFLDVDPKKIVVIPPSIDPVFEKESSAIEKSSVRNKYTLPKNYVLIVATVEYRKNLLTLVRAMSLIKKKIPLVVVGKHTNHIIKIKKLMDELNLKDRVLFINKVEFSDLPAIYQMADVFVYPSLYEGFGLPIVEALLSKVPVIASNLSSMPEAAGKHSLLVAPEDAQAIADGIDSVLSQPLLKAGMIEEGYKHAKQFTEAHIAKKLIQLYKSLLSK